MTVATYVLASGSTWKGSAITDGTDFSYSESSNSNKITTDGSRSVNLITVDQKTVTVTLNGINQSLLSSSNYRAGASGALVLKGKLRGAGDTTSTAITFTFGEAVCVGSTGGTPNDGNGSISISWEAYDSNDDNSLVAIS